jgi:hypothetical protein
MIDIEKEREWLAKPGYTQATQKAHLYLDELAGTRDELQKERALYDATTAQANKLRTELRQLRAQLANQRARDIRMLAVEAYGIGSTLSERDVERVAEAYDRLAAIPVPPPAVTSCAEKEPAPLLSDPCPHPYRKGEHEEYFIDGRVICKACGAQERALVGFSGKVPPPSEVERG